MNAFLKKIENEARVKYASLLWEWESKNLSEYEVKRNLVKRKKLLETITFMEHLNS